MTAASIDGVPDSIVVRSPNAADGPRLGEAHVLAWQIGYRSILPGPFLAALDPVARGEWWTERFTDGADGHRADKARCAHLVAELNGEITGGVTYGIYRPLDGQAADEGRAENRCELWGLNLHPDAWGRGVAQALMRETITGLRTDHPEPIAVLWVLEGNARGRRFYEKEGWAADGISKVEEIGGRAVTELRYAIEL